jgi:nitrogen regulatory protein PII
LSSQLQGTVSLDLLVVIVDRGKGSRVLKLARQNGVTGGTIMLGHGTFRSKNALYIDDINVRKDVVLMLSDQKIAEKAIRNIDQEMDLIQPNHGIGFMLSVHDLLGTFMCRKEQDQAMKGDKAAMMQAIFTIVNKGLAETVVKAAESAGSRGATVINARGAGVHETARLFSMDIEPEKEIVLILVNDTVCQPVVHAIREAAELDQPGKGLLFTVDIRESCGL